MSVYALIDELKVTCNLSVKEFLEPAHNQHLVALVYIGYPAMEAGRVERTGFEDRTMWME